MPDRLLCLDIETVPDRELLPPERADAFPRTIHHKVVCVSFVEAEIERSDEGCERYVVTGCRSGGEPDWDERRLLESFWSFFSRRATRLVTWNGRAFDMPTLLHRSMMHGVTAKGWYGGGRYDNYGYRYSDRLHCDLMDVISDFGASQRLSLQDTAVACGYPGKIGGHGSEVEAMVRAGRLVEVRAYCEIDTINLFGLYARQGLLTGRLDRSAHDASLASLSDHLEARRSERTHFGTFLDGWTPLPRLAP